MKKDKGIIPAKDKATVTDLPHVGAAFFLTLANKAKYRLLSPLPNPITTNGAVARDRTLKIIAIKEGASANVTIGGKGNVFLQKGDFVFDHPGAGDYIVLAPGKTYKFDVLNGKIKIK